MFALIIRYVRYLSGTFALHVRYSYGLCSVDIRYVYVLYGLSVTGGNEQGRIKPDDKISYSVGVRNVIRYSVRGA